MSSSWLRGGQVTGNPELPASRGTHGTQCSVTQGPGSGRVAGKVPPVSQFGLWVASVQCKGQQVRILVEGLLPRAGHLPRQFLGLQSQKLLANGT